MDIAVASACVISLAVIPFAAGVVLATWRQRRAMLERSRDLTLELGPKVLLGVALTGAAAGPAAARPTAGPPSAAASSVATIAAPAWLPVLDRAPTIPHPAAPEPTTTGQPASDVGSVPKSNPEAQRPESPPTAAGPTDRPTRPPAARPGILHTVRAGDTLWSITASLLGSSATNAQIARAWPEVFDLNRSVIGADPNLLLPGQTLQIPASLGSVAR